MPDDVKISEMSEAASLDNSAQFPYVQSMNGNLTTLKAPLSQIGTKINEGMTFSNLQTTSKNIVGAINEAAQGGGVEYATELPISSTDPTDTKSYIDTKTTLVKSASGSLIHITDGGDNIPMKSCEIDIEPDLSGYTEANLFVCGKNLLPMFTPTTSSGVDYTVDNNGVVTASGQATGNSRIGQYLYLPTGDYVLSGASSSSTLGVGDTYVTRVSDGVVIARDYTGSTDTDKQFTLTQTERLYIACRFVNAATTTSTTRVFYPQIERGETSSDYTPYNCTTYNIPFGQTVTAGGTLDVISGELVVGGVTTQLTPVSPKTISGVNNIYNDCGDTAIEYFTSSADEESELIRKQPMPLHHYSLGEVEIGTWIDGSTLYEKTIQITSLSVGQSTLQHGISNFDTLVSVSGRFTRADGKQSPISNVSTDTKSMVYAFNFADTSFVLFIGDNYQGATALSSMYLTIQYTKTT